MKKLLSISLLLCAFQAQSAIQVESSRVIYTAKESNATLSVRNISAENYIVQSWLEGPSAEKVPFAVTPPLVKLRPEQSTLLRFIYSGKGLPEDRESVFWINVQEIPPAAKDANVLQIAIRTRLKLFYRPKGITNRLEDEVNKMSWAVKDTELSIKNSGPLNITLSSIQLTKFTGENVSINAQMISPFSTAIIKVPKYSRLSAMKYINDYGATIDIPVKP